jgi:hypothetical protein
MRICMKNLITYDRSGGDWAKAHDNICSLTRQSFGRKLAEEVCSILEVQERRKEKEKKKRRRSEGYQAPPQARYARYAGNSMQSYPPLQQGLPTYGEQLGYRQPRRCFGCNGLGHIQANCPMNMGGQRPTFRPGPFPGREGAQQYGRF